MIKEFPVIVDLALIDATTFQFLIVNFLLMLHRIEKSSLAEDKGHLLLLIHALRHLNYVRILLHNNNSLYLSFIGVNTV